MFAFGAEPGGGTDDQCDVNDREINRTQFFFDTDTGRLLGTWTMNPPQTEVENCSIHNYNFVPTLNGRDIIVGGHYQAGTWAVDVTDPAHPQVIARADPPPLNPAAFSIGGAWSSYWYNGLIYEAEITKGLHIFRLNTPDTAPGRFRSETFSNPQTQMSSINLGTCRGTKVTLAGTNAKDTINGTSLADVISGLNGNDRLNGRDNNDAACGGGGKDKLKGGTGGDVLVGGAKADTLNGGKGRDVCIGGPGRDTAKGCEVRRSI
jgi:Ca2+-binding RTX toxin-like protein